MKIIYCIGALIKPGGTEKVLCTKMNYFTESLGYEVHLILNDQKKHKYIFDLSDKIKVHDMAISSFIRKPIIPYFTNKILQHDMTPKYLNLINNIDPDFIIVAQQGIDDYIIPKLNLKIPKVREIHFSWEGVKITSTFIKNPIKRLVYRIKKNNLLRNLNKYDHLILLTDRDKKNGPYKTNTTVIPNMLDFPSVDNSRNFILKKNIISVGSMNTMNKGFDFQIKIWNEIAKKFPEWKLNIYGDGKERNFLQDLINKYNLTQSIILHGVSNEIEKKYENSDVFLFTSRAEGLPMVLIEAMSKGLPCVSFDSPTGPGEIIENDMNGYLFSPGDIKGVSNKLEYLMNNPKKIKDLSKGAILTSKNYSVERVAELWQEFFKNQKIQD